MVHILRREHVNDNCFSALGWTPEARSKGETKFKDGLEKDY